jgi:hypothetical protein
MVLTTVRFLQSNGIFGGVNMTISDALHIICMGKPFVGKENRELLNQTEIEAEPWNRPQKKWRGKQHCPHYLGGAVFLIHQLYLRLN